MQRVGLGLLVLFQRKPSRATELLDTQQFSAREVFDDPQPTVDLRAVFRRERCLPASQSPSFPFEQDHLWILEANPWASHRLATAVAAILLREFLGYSVDINVVDSTEEVYQRAAKAEVQHVGEAVREHVAAGDREYGYANVEVWPEGKREAFVEFVAQGRQAVEMGLLGYEGREGWFVPASFVENSSFAIPAEFYRAYDASRNASSDVLAALLKHAAVACDVAECCCRSLASCPAAGRLSAWGEVRWCPQRSSGTLPGVMVRSDLRQEGLQEELVRSNGFRFAIRSLGSAAFSQLATEALSSGAAQLVHSWRPSVLLARLRHRQAKATRIVLPSEGCGVHKSDGSGDWSCDMPRQALQKLASREVNGDPVAQDFFSRFSLHEARPLSSEQFLGSLAGGAGIRELLEALVASADGEGRPARDEEVFDVACQWVLANEELWALWAKPRDVPFFADTLSAFYPFPALLILLLLAVVYAVFIETAWLRTTLSPLRIREILAKNKHRSWRTSLEMRLRSFNKEGLDEQLSTEAHATVLGCSDKPKKKLARSYSESEGAALQAQRPYWEGLSDRATATSELMAFWWRMERCLAKAKPGPPEPEDFVHFASHVFACLDASGVAVVLLCRSLKAAFKSGKLTVEVAVEANDGGAKDGSDFQAGTHQVCFPAGTEFAVLHIPVMHKQDSWQNSCWFQVRLTRVGEGQAALASPAQATVLILSNNQWPANLPERLRGGLGISLMRYFIHSHRVNRGDKWTKTMIAMVWLPVHSVLVSTLVQKVIVDHAMQAVVLESGGRGATWSHLEIALLVLVQLLSLGLHRWADVVQVRHRGRTGGVRVRHRTELLRKFIHLEHVEHWEASEASWLYSAINDVDVITTNAYFQIFVLAQSCFALALSVGLVLALAIAQDSGRVKHPEMLFYPLGLFLMIPIGLLGAWLRRILLWVVVIARKSGERNWFGAYTWIVTHWKDFHGLLLSELLALEKMVGEHNKIFVPAHWDARDTMNDTAWIMHWVTGVAYCVMLLLGSFALIEYEAYGLGGMEVGTFYAFCKIYLSVGKYVGRLSGVFLHMQQAVVSVREVAALLNQAGQTSRHREALLWARLGAQGGRPPGYGLEAIVFEAGVNFARPRWSKVGSTFAELRLAKRCELSLGRLTLVHTRNEHVVRSFLALAAQVLHPNGSHGEDLPEGAPRILAPPTLRAMLLPAVPTNLSVTASTIVDQLELTDADPKLCRALACCVGLDPEAQVNSLGPGSAQVFSLVRGLLADPDVLCAFRPMSLVPSDMWHHVSVLLRVWQARGGLPGLAQLLGIPPPKLEEGDTPVYRSPVRTLVVGNADAGTWKLQPSELVVDLDALLWRGPLSAGPDDSPQSQTPKSSMLLKGVPGGPVQCRTGCFGFW